MDLPRHLIRMYLRDVSNRGTNVVFAFANLIPYMYKEQNTNFSTTWEGFNLNANWCNIQPLVVDMLCVMQLRGISITNLSETFGNNQIQSYDSVEVYLEELFKRCEKFARQKKRDLMLFKFTTGVCISLGSIFTFIFFELGFGFVAFKSRSKIAFALFEWVSTACLVCSFVFAWGIFASILFSNIFLLRTLAYFRLTIERGVKLYQKKIKKISRNAENRQITSFDKHKGSIKKLIKRIGELEHRRRLQNELMQGEEQQSVINNVKSDINDVPLMVIAEGKVEII